MENFVGACDLLRVNDESEGVEDAQCSRTAFAVCAGYSYLVVERGRVNFQYISCKVFITDRRVDDDG